MSEHPKHGLSAFDCTSDAARARAKDRLVTGQPHPDEAKRIGREGMVTVFASDGTYLGCMGRETWQALLETGPESYAALVADRERLKTETADLHHELLILSQLLAFRDRQKEVYGYEKSHHLLDTPLWEDARTILSHLSPPAGDEGGHE